MRFFTTCMILVAVCTILFGCGSEINSPSNIENDVFEDTLNADNATNDFCIPFEDRLKFNLSKVIKEKVDSKKHIVIWEINSEIASVEKPFFVKSMRFWVTRNMDPNSEVVYERNVSLNMILNTNDTFFFEPWRIQYTDGSTSGFNSSFPLPIVWMKPELCEVNN